MKRCRQIDSVLLQRQPTTDAEANYEISYVHSCSYCTVHEVTNYTAELSQPARINRKAGTIWHHASCSTLFMLCLWQSKNNGGFGLSAVNSTVHNYNLSILNFCAWQCCRSRYFSNIFSKTAIDFSIKISPLVFPGLVEKPPKIIDVKNVFTFFIQGNVFFLFFQRFYF